MRAANVQTVGELAQRVAELTGSVAELTRRLELAEAVRGNGSRNQQIDASVRYADDSSNPIEFITENGFSIVRPWECGRGSAPADGNCCFRVSDAAGVEREVTVQISDQAVVDAERRTRGRIQLSSSFWICCAERHLADYVSEHDDFPEHNNLIIDELDCGDILLAIRWGKSG
jgi:hypothetical protein